jgi:hypothetical protein
LNCIPLKNFSFSPKAEIEQPIILKGASYPMRGFKIKFSFSTIIYLLMLTACNNTASLQEKQSNQKEGNSSSRSTTFEQVISLKGVIQDFKSGSSFIISNRLIDASQAELDPPSLQLANGIGVLIEGATVDGKVEASRVTKTQTNSPIGGGLSPAAVIDASPVQGVAPLAVSFDASGSTGDGGIAAYNWSFGDGEQATGITTDHSYMSPGKYVVSLTIKDSAGNKGSTSIPVEALVNRSPSQPNENTPINTVMRVGENFGFLASDQPDNSPFINNVDFSAAWSNGKSGYLVNTNVWKPEFLSDISNYSVLRFLNWTATNGNHIKNWSDVLLPVDSQNNNIQGFTPNPGSLYRVMAYEWQIDLCNRIGADMWITVPAHTDVSSDDYWGKLARVIRDNLDPSLKVYIEYSNEIWNFAFEQRDYINRQAQVAGISGDDNTRVWKYTVKASADLWQVFINEFGGRNRLKLVLPGQSANPYMAEAHYQNLNDASLNPNGLRPDVYAIAPYVGHEINSSGSNVFAQLRKELKSVTRPQLERHRELADANKIELVTYEGGQHVYKGGRVASINRDPKMYAFYKDYLTMLSEYVPLTMNFMYSGHYSDQYGNAWGSKEFIMQPIDKAHKYRAIQDWIKESRP